MKPLRIVQIIDPRLSPGPKIFTSLEGENPGGSIKDHMVSRGLQAMIASGALGPGRTVAEASAGSTALSLAHYSAELGVRCALFVPDSMAPERLERMRRLGAELHVVPMEKGLELFAEFAKRPGIVPFNQITDIRHRMHYRPLGEQVKAELGRVDAVIGAVGTGHSLLGIAEGIAPRPWVATAEPLGFESPGVRNVVTTRHGADDPCTADLFDQRIEVATNDLFEGAEVKTSAGRMGFPDSFRLVLAAVARLRAKGPPDTVFLVGASNLTV